MPWKPTSNPPSATITYRHSDGPSRLLIRPEQLVLHREAIEQATSAIVVEVQYHGHDALARIRLAANGGQAVVARAPGDLDLSPGDKVWIDVVGTGKVWSSPKRPETEHAPGANGDAN